jgi:hypothetical protein
LGIISGGNSGLRLAHFYDNTPFCGCFFMSNLRQLILADFGLAQTTLKPLVLLTFNLRQLILADFGLAQLDC